MTSVSMTNPIGRPFSTITLPPLVQPFCSRIQFEAARGFMRFIRV